LPLSLLCQEGRCSINFGKDDSGIWLKCGPATTQRTI
jgi:hypothetical protein